MHALRLPLTIAADASTRRRYACLATVTSAWLLESFRQAPAPQAIVDARAIRDALRNAGYTSRALGARVLGGTPVAAAAAPTQVLRRTPEGKAPPRDDEVDALIALRAGVERGEGRGPGGDVRRRGAPARRGHDGAVHGRAGGCKRATRATTCMW